MKTKSFINRYSADLLHNNIAIGVILIFCMFLIGLIVNKNFLSPESLGNIFTNASLLALASLGQTLVIISGGVDLSVSGCISIGAVVSALIMMGDNSNIPLTIIVLVIIGFMVGIANASGVIYAKIPPLVMTLAVSNVLIVIQLIACNGSPTGSPAPAVRFFGKFKFIPIFSLITVLLIAVGILVYFGLEHNGYAKQLYAVGNNHTAAILAGINSNKIIYITYIISAVINCLVGMVLLGYINFPYINMGASYGMETIAAAVIGGASFSGGKGHFSGTIIGAMVLTILSNILIAIQLNDSVKSVINGLVLLIILAFYTKEKSIRA